MSCQSNNRKTPIVVWLAIWLACPWTVAAGTTIKTEHTEARLLSEQLQIEPGQSFWLALQLTPESGWHTYWKNPGDAGKATAIQWSLPGGSHAGPLHWPYPQRIRTGSLVSFGYTDTVSLLTEIKAGLLPAGAEHIEITAAADWLVCAEICIPESAVLTLKLPVHSAGAMDPATAAVFKSARALLPAAADWTAHYIYKDSQLIFDVPLKTAAELETVLFFPVEDNLIENASNQSFLLGKKTVRVSVGAGHMHQTDPFHGVLVLKRKAATEALEFTAQPVPQLPDLDFTTSPGNQ